MAIVTTTIGQMPEAAELDGALKTVVAAAEGPASASPLAALLAWLIAEGAGDGAIAEILNARDEIRDIVAEAPDAPSVLGKLAIADAAAPTGLDLLGFRMTEGATPRTAADKLRETAGWSAVDKGLEPNSVADQSSGILALWSEGRAFVPEGKFRVDVNTPTDGLYGPGVILRGGTDHVQLPLAPVGYDMARKAWSVLAQVIATNGGVCLLGTSINEGYDFADPLGPELDWFSNLRHHVGFATQSRNHETLTHFGDMARYGVSHTGGAAGVVGAVKSSWIMQVDDTLSFTGDFTYVDIWRETDPSHGKIEVRRNGVLYKTIDCGLAADSDVPSFPTTQSAAGVATYELKCIDAPVQLTGLTRANGSPGPTCYFTRMAVAGSSTERFMDRIPSILKVGAGIGGGRSLFIIDHLINNYHDTLAGAGTTVATYRAHLETLFQAIMDAGHLVICVGGMKPDVATFPGHGETWEAFAAAQRSVCDQYDVPLIDMGVADWVARGLYSDGVHMTLAGSSVRNNAFMVQFCNLPRLASRVYPFRGLQTIRLTLGDDATAVTTGDGQLRFRAPYRCRLISADSAALRASVATASTAGNVQINMKVGGVSVLDNPLYVGEDQTSSVEAASGVEVSDTLIPDDAEVTFDIDGAGTGAEGLQIAVTIRSA